MMRLILTACLLFGQLSLQAQALKLKVVEDEWGIKGEIRSSFAYNDSILPQQGKIDIRWRELNQSQLTTYRVKGQTQNHLPTGKWTWEEAAWDYKVEVGESIKPLFNAKGTRLKWQGAFKAGKPDGLWIFTIDEQTNNGAVKPLKYISITYKNGNPSGPISLENYTTKVKIRGATDEQGIAKGIWSYTYKTTDGTNVLEERVYQKGLLTEIRLTEGNVKSLKKIDTNIRFLEKVGTKDSTDGKRIGDIRFPQDEQGGIAMNLLQNTLQKFNQNGWKLDVFPFEFVREMPAFKKLEYPLTAEEKADIAYSHQLINKQKEYIENLLSGNTYILRSRSGKLDTTIAFLEINRKRMVYMDSLLNRTDHPTFTYKNRNEQNVYHWIEELNTDRKQPGLVYDSLQTEVVSIPTPKDSINIFRIFKDFLVYNEKTLPPYYDYVEQERLSLKKEGELKKQEDVIEQRLKEMQDFYVDKTGIGNLIYTQWIKGEIEDVLQQYSQQQYDEALQTGNRLLVRLDSLTSWKSMLDTFDRMPMELQSHYRYLAYNPYTGANDIEITAKKRFINSVLNQMWPYMLLEMEQEKDWNKWIVLWTRQFDVYHYLLNFVSRDDSGSKRVESRVRKEKKPERMLKLILNEMNDH